MSKEHKSAIYTPRLEILNEDVDLNSLQYISTDEYMADMTWAGHDGIATFSKSLPMNITTWEVVDNEIILSAGGKNYKIPRKD